MSVVVWQRAESSWGKSESVQSQQISKHNQLEITASFRWGMGVECCLICLKMFCGTWDVWHATASITMPAHAYKLSAGCKQTWQLTTVKKKMRHSQTVDKAKPNLGLWGGFWHILCGVTVLLLLLLLFFGDCGPV